MKAAPIKNLSELKRLKQEIERQAKMQAEQEAARLQAQRLAQAQQQLFARSVGPVRPLASKHRQSRPVAAAPPQPVPVQHRLDEEAVMREALSDEFDVETLLETDEALSFRRPGLGPDVVRKLRRGGWRLQGQFDLHGFRREDARQALADFIREAHKNGWRCVRVVHGKGLGSPGKTPVLKGRVQSWLVQKKEVLAFVQARPAEGGAGALVVLLAPVGAPPSARSGF
ncbi:MAG: DNA mismatch repair protein MutS [Betaproteobacteria bacterium]|nr:DNA mismatch repair protein MutS [Betaproteobacteria bacterium]